MLKKLHNAVRSGKVEKVEWLLDNELKGEEDIINRTSDGVSSSLMVACQQPGSPGMIKCLLRRGAKHNVGGWTALMKAVESNSLDNARCLIEMKDEYDLQLEFQRYGGETALMIACRKGYLELVQLLVASGADVVGKESDSSRYQKSPLAIAIENGHLEVTKFLIDKGAIVIYHYRSDYYRNYPGRDRFQTDLTRILLERGVDFSSMLSHEGETHILIYTTSGQTDLVKLCLEKGHDVDEGDNYGIYPLWRAVEQRHYELFELLWSKGADPEIRPNDRKSALEMLKENKSLMSHFLSMATKKNNLQLVEFLRKNGAQFNGQEKQNASLQSSDIMTVKHHLGVADDGGDSMLPNSSSSLQTGSASPNVSDDLPMTDGSDCKETAESDLLNPGDGGKKQRRESSASTEENIPAVVQGTTFHDDTKSQQCPICEEAIDNISDTIICTGPSCNAPVHRQCAGLSKNKFERASKSQFTCPHCRLESLEKEVLAIKRALSAKESTPASRKRFRIILRGVEECEAGTAKHARHEEDLAKIIKALSTVHSVQPQAIKDHHRLGVYNKDQEHPRPILVHFVRSADVSTILFRKKLVEPPYSIHHYMTRAELARSAEQKQDTPRADANQEHAS